MYFNEVRSQKEKHDELRSKWLNYYSPRELEYTAETPVGNVFSIQHRSVNRPIYYQMVEREYY